MNVTMTYKDGVEIEHQEFPAHFINPSPRLRKKVNKFLREFLDSDKDYAEIEFGGDIVPHTICKAYFNLKTCANHWRQYVFVAFEGWPDLIGKQVEKDIQGDSGSVMLNEILSENYTSQEDYIPLGYKVVKKGE